MAAIFLLLISCSGGNDQDTPPPQAKKISEVDVPQFEGSRSKSAYPEKEGVDQDGAHPEVKEGIKLERGIVIPKEVEGQWKAVKILVLNKSDEARNSVKTVSIGSSFELEGTGITVAVGPFMPNFVMTQKSYSSTGNELTNPAVQLVVEENGKTLYTGWAFAKYPTMYAFEHDEYALQLMDYIPADVS